MSVCNDLVIMAAGLQLTRQTVLLALGGITLPLLIPLAQVHRYLPFFSSYSPRPGWDHTTAADTAGAGTPVPTILQFLFSGQCNFCPLRSPEL